MSLSNVAKVTAPKPVNANCNGVKPTKDKKSKPEPTHKPKRPLSGYNLFYRYKRTKILEFTAHAKPESDTNTIINAVITALPGLENVNAQNHPLWTNYPPLTIDKLRAHNIRSSMEGNIFPNEDGRNRLHRKSLGVGFVEMSRTMREMWANVDNATKEVFCELAEEGRVRYRTLMAEWKVSMENETTSEDGGMPAQLQQVASWVAPNGNTKNKSKSHTKQLANKRLKTTHSNSNKDATVKASTTCLAVLAAASTATMASSPPTKINATPEAVETPNAIAYVSPATHQVQVQAARIPNFISSSSTSVNNRNKRGLRCDSLEPVHIETRSLEQTANPIFTDLAALNKPMYGGCVSDESDLDPQIHSSCSSTSMANDSDPVVTGNDVSATNTAAASQEITNEFQHEFQKFLETNAAIIEKAATMSNSVGRNFIHNSTVDSSSNSCSSNKVEKNQESVTPRNEEVSAQDFTQFIGQLIEAIDQHDDVCHTSYSEEENIDDCFDIYPSLIFGDDHHTSTNKSSEFFDRSLFTLCDETQKSMDVWDDNHHSFIFGKPMKDVKINSISNAVPMPVAFKLNNNRARMA